MDAAVYLPHFHNSEAAIAHSILYSTFINMLDKVSVLHKSQYEAQYNCTPELRESQFETVVTLS